MQSKSPGRLFQVVPRVGMLMLICYLTDVRANNIQTVQLARFMQGAFGSTGATMVGGTIADIWDADE